MKHKERLSKDEKRDKIDYLKKQRDGLIIGEYRNILAQIYGTIKKPAYDTLDKLYQVYRAESEHDKNVILDYCLDLEQLGYVKIKYTGHLQLLKELDF